MWSYFSAGELERSSLVVHGPTASSMAVPTTVHDQDARWDREVPFQRFHRQSDLRHKNYWSVRLLVTAPLRIIRRERVAASFCLAVVLNLYILLRGKPCMRVRRKLLQPSSRKVH